MPFLMPPLFITAVKDICTINTFEKLNSMAESGVGDHMAYNHEIEV